MLRNIKALPLILLCLTLTYFAVNAQDEVNTSAKKNTNQNKNQQLQCINKLYRQPRWPKLQNCENWQPVMDGRKPKIQTW
jgi:hypothetical protein